MGCPGRGGLEGPQYGAHADGYPRCSRLFAPELAPRGGREEGVRVVSILVPWAHLFPRAAACDGSRAPARRLASCLGLWPTFFQAHADLRLRAYPRSEQRERDLSRRVTLRQRRHLGSPLEQAQAGREHRSVPGSRVCVLTTWTTALASE